MSTYRIEVITLRKYLSLKQDARAEYDFVIKYSEAAKAKDFFKFGSLFECSFGFVKDLQYLYSIPDMDAIKFFDEFFNILHTHKGVSKDTILNMSVFSFYSMLFYLSEQIKEINNKELNLVTSTNNSFIYPDSERFNKYNSFIQLLTLANDDITKIDAVRNIQYSIAFTYLLYKKDLQEYEQEFRTLNEKRS